jgi:hypothetical protein
VRQLLRLVDARAGQSLIRWHGEVQQSALELPQQPIDLDRSRKVIFGRIAQKPAPMLMLRTLTVKMTVKVCGAAASALRINSLEGSLMIEWE